MKLKQFDNAYAEDGDLFDPGYEDTEELSGVEDAGYADEESSENDEDTHSFKHGKETADRNYRLLFAYFSDLNRESLLTKRDEAVLAAKIKVCEAGVKRISRIANPVRARKHKAVRSTDTLNALHSSYASKSKLYQEKFIKSNLRLVIELANRYSGRGLPLTDLIQEGNIGLMKAVTKFDHTKGFKFSTYASWWINQSLSRAVMEQTQVISIPVYLQELSAKVFKAKAKLEHNSEVRALPEQIAEATGLPQDAVNAILKGRDLVVPLDIAPGEDDTKTYLDITPDPETRRPEQYITSRSITREVRDSLSLLTERERDILKMRFGIDYEDDHKLDQIAVKYGLSRERVRQIEREALTKLAGSEHSRALKALLN